MNHVENYETFWKDILEDGQGNISHDQLMKELSDYSKLISNVTKLYDSLTRGTISNPLTDIKHIEDEVKKRIDESYDEGYNDGYWRE